MRKKLMIAYNIFSWTGVVLAFVFMYEVFAKNNITIAAEFLWVALVFVFIGYQCFKMAKHFD